jgi:ribonuclease HI
MSMSHLEDDEHGAEGIIGRQMVFCKNLRESFSTSELITHCWRCRRFLVRCCAHLDHPEEKICHHHRLVFTDGSCLDNGRASAKAGIGIALGHGNENEKQQWSISVDDKLDPGQKRSSQRAELLAAIEGLKYLSRADRGEVKHAGTHGDRRDYLAWVIATDSEYVVKGMTEWLPVWKVSALMLQYNCP